MPFPKLSPPSETAAAVTVIAIENAVTIERATLRDIPAMVRLLSILFTIENDFSPNMEKQEKGLTLMLADGKKRRVMVARTNGKVIGMATGQIVVSTAEGGLSVWVEDVIVDREYRRSRVGSMLLASLEEWARHVGAQRLQLLTETTNAHALAFYDANDWNQTNLACLRKILPAPPKQSL
jgi:ribosomal protein S18 acetylase RimI-like enzyme